MDKNNEKLPDLNVFDEAETKKDLVHARIKKAQVEVKNIDFAEAKKTKETKKASKKKRNVGLPSPAAKSPAARSPVGFPRKTSDDKHNEVVKYQKPPGARLVQEQEKEKPIRNKKTKTITETEEEDVSERKFIKFVEQLSFIENGVTLNTYFLLHLLNAAQSLKSYDAFSRNTIKNRNPDVYCIDKTRVKLSDPSIDHYYIHANHIKLEQLMKSYIATQHPLTGTLNDFWAMIADQKVNTIVSLTNFTASTNQTTFPIYYPNKSETFRNFGQFFVYCNTVTPPKTKYGCIEYKFELVVQSEKEEKRNIRLYHYPHWNKSAVPASTKVVLDIVKKLRRKKSQAPIVVQCETGVNQSAEIIFVDAICSMLESNVEANFDTLFRQMRKQRAQMMTQRLHFLHSIATILDFIKNYFKPVPPAIVSQIESIMYSISKDFPCNTSVEPADETNQMKSPTMDELVAE